MVKLSIIIPYFETYELTRKLLNSLLIQITDDVEIILLDDGCNEFRFDSFRLANDNIKIIHKQNEGVAKTRNKGIELAEGKYVAFIDCDDMVMPNYIETLLDAIDKYDTDIINFNWYDLTECVENKRPTNPAPWKNIYKKETMMKFREDMSYGSEDEPYQEEINSGKFTITYLDKLLYIYNSNREGSLFWKKTHEVQ